MRIPHPNKTLLLPTLTLLFLLAHPHATRADNPAPADDVNLASQPATDQTAAEAGDPAAMVQFATRLLNGDGLIPDPILAIVWFQKAANAGNADAMYNLSLLYANGRGVEQDPAQALIWLQKAANAGSEKAKKLLASNPATTTSPTSNP